MVDTIIIIKTQCHNPRCKALARVVVRGGAKYCLKHYQIRAVDLYKLNSRLFDEMAQQVPD